MNNIEFPEVYTSFFQSDKRFKILLGGRYSAKSYQAFIYYLLKLTGKDKFRLLCLRTQKEKIETTVYNGFIEVIEKYGDVNDFIFYKSPFKIVHKGTKNEIIFGGLSSPNSYKGLTGISDVYLDEGEDMTEEEFHTIDLSIRGGDYKNQTFTISLNPISEYLFYKKRFFDNPCKDTFTLVTTYLDNPWCPPSVHAKYERMKFENPERYNVEALALWGVENRNANYYKKFSMGIHTGKTVYNDEKPIILSYDFNKNPGCSLLIIQLHGNEFHVLEEIFLENPHNTTRDVTLEFIRKYKNHDAGIIVCGDASGKWGEVNQFLVIQQELERFKPKVRIPAKNPPVMAKQDFINAVFDENFERLSILIDKKCEKLILDLVSVKEDNGTKFKPHWRNPKTGIKEERYGHFSDAFDYAFIEMFKKEFEFHSTGKRSFFAILGKKHVNKHAF